MKRKMEGGEEAPSALWWIRQDLRTEDNGSLAAAIQHANEHEGRVFACYVISPDEYRRQGWAPIKVDLILRSLRTLSATLQSMGITVASLELNDAEDHDGRLAKMLVEFCHEHGIGAVYFSRHWEPVSLARDQRVKDHFLSANLPWSEYVDGECVVREGTILQRDGERPYAVFTPFRRALYEHVQRYPVELTVLPQVINSEKAKLIGSIPDAVKGFSLKDQPGLNSDLVEKIWPAGEEAARQRLAAFLALHSDDYHESRDRYADEVVDPEGWGTSRLSPYLALGIISPRRCWLDALAQNGGRPENPAHPGLTSWLSELIWRDFYRHLVHHHPRLLKSGEPYRLETQSVPWESPDEGFKRWTEGRTGVPLVDAAMRQLTQTGWMHNRLRMLVASYLTKHLLTHWQHGADHFMRSLIDGDWCSNQGGWQWASSCGVDSQPYFRIFSARSQTLRFDPQCSFVRRWLPELKSVPADRIPWMDEEKGGPSEVERSRWCHDYPKPLIYHSVGRQRAIETFKRIFTK